MLMCLVIQAQISPFVVNSTGNTTQYTGGYLGWSVGESVVGTTSASTIIITQGFLGILASGETVSGTVTYPNTDNAPLDNLTVNLVNSTGFIVKTATTNANGNFSFTGVNAGDYSLDVSTTKPWGGVSAADVLLYKKHIANISFLTGIFLASGDVNGSGGLSASDVLLIKKRIASIISSFSVGDWLFNDLPFNVGSGNIIQNFNGIIYGDANHSYIPTEADLLIKQGTISMETVNDVEGEITVPVHISDMSDLGSFQFTITYDPGKVQFTGVDHWYDGINDVTVGNTVPGQLTFVWAADDKGINITDGILCNLRFTTKTSGQSALSFENNPTLKEFSDYEGKLFEPEFINGVVGSTTGISEQNLTVISVYPNPNNGIFTLQINNKNTREYTVSISNSLGIVVFQKNHLLIDNGSNAFTLNLSNLANGIYTLSVMGTKNTFNQRLIIQK